MILLTGFNGFVGAALHEAIRQQYTELLLLERVDTLDAWRCDFEALMGKHLVDTVILCGAISNNQYDKNDIFDWNTYSVGIAASACQRYGAHLIYFSSQVADAPTTRYGHSKKLAELLIQRTSGLDACILRPFNIWGAGEVRKPAYCQSLPYRLAARTLEVLWDTSRDYVHVSDVVDAVMLAQRHRTCGVFEVGTGTAVSADALASKVAWRGYRREPRPGHIQGYACATRSRVMPAWEPKIAVLDSIDTLVAEVSS